MYDNISNYLSYGEALYISSLFCDLLQMCVRDIQRRWSRTISHAGHTGIVLAGYQ